MLTGGGGHGRDEGARRQHVPLDLLGQLRQRLELRRVVPQGVQGGGGADVNAGGGGGGGRGRRRGVGRGRGRLRGGGQ